MLMPWRPALRVGLLALSVGLALEISHRLPNRHVQSSTHGVVTWGAHLTQQDQQAMLRKFGIRSSAVPTIYVEAAQAGQMLGESASLGRPKDRGLVATYLRADDGNLGVSVSAVAPMPGVSPNALQNALVTAGVSQVDARVAALGPASAPEVLGDLLVGAQAIHHGPISPTATRLATQELMMTDRLGKNPNQSAHFVATVKRDMVTRHFVTASQIRPLIMHVSGAYDLRLSRSDTNELTRIMLGISHLPVNRRAIEAASADVAQPESWWDRFVTWLQKIVGKMKQALGVRTRVGTFLDPTNPH
jgi:uncharacterized protein YpuA (DUF1002 family)